MKFTRRRFLRRSLAAGAALALPWRLQARAEDGVDGTTLTRYVDALPIPPDWSSGKLSAMGLTMAESVHQFHSELGPSKSWGYAGASYLGPTIQATRGVPVSYTAYNQLGPHVLQIDDTLHGPNLFPPGFDQAHPRVSVHLHGGYTEEASDGHPELYNFRPGESRTYHYAYDQQAGTTWHHDHALGYTRLNVYAGLASFHLIRDPSAEAGLPPDPFEVVIAIQDKAFEDPGDGTNPLFYPDPWEPEFFGDVAVVNGKAWPYLEVARGWYRFRLLNGSSSRFYNLRLESDSGRVVPLVQIGTDSGLINAPRALDNLVLSPGERADVLVDFGPLGAGATVRLKNLELPDYVVSPAEFPLDELMEFRLLRPRGFARKPPALLRRKDPVIAPGPVSVVRNVLLTEIIDAGEEMPLMALLNARLWDTTDIEQPHADAVERWNIINLTPDTHPIHLHLVQFLLEGRDRFDSEGYLLDNFGTTELGPDDIIPNQGVQPGLVNASADGYVSGPGPVDAWEAGGWKDTVQAHPGMITRILVPFGGAAAPGVPFGQRNRFTGDYVWHCHILDHEDNEMMLPYRVLG
jgi:spore coat protein A